MKLTRSATAKRPRLLQLISVFGGRGCDARRYGDGDVTAVECHYRHGSSLPVLVDDDAARWHVAIGSGRTR